MRFYDRESELQTLQKLLQQRKREARMTVLMGRRRIGKTELSVRLLLSDLRDNWMFFRRQLWQRWQLFLPCGSEVADVSCYNRTVTTFFHAAAWVVPVVIVVWLIPVMVVLFYTHLGCFPLLPKAELVLFLRRERLPGLVIIEDAYLGDLPLAGDDGGDEGMTWWRGVLIARWWGPLLLRLEGCRSAWCGRERSVLFRWHFGRTEQVAHERLREIGRGWGGGCFVHVEHRTGAPHEPVGANIWERVVNGLHDFVGGIGATGEDGTQRCIRDADAAGERLLVHVLGFHELFDSILHRVCILLLFFSCCESSAMSWPGGAAG